MKETIKEQVLRIRKDESKIVSVLIGTPYHSRIEPDCSRCIAQLGGIPGFKFYTSQVKGSNIHILRNKLYKELLETECDLFLGVDADTAFTPQNFLQLYKQHTEKNLPLVFGVYSLKGTNFLDAGKFKSGFPGEIGDRFLQSSGGLNKVDWTGMGFYIITRSLVEKIGSPWFDGPSYKRSDGSVDTAQDDISFCLRLKRRNEKILVDCDCKVEHLYRPDEINGVASVALTQELWKDVISGVEHLSYKKAKAILTEMSLQLKPQLKTDFSA